MRPIEETKKILSDLIKNDKKHLRFFDKNFDEYEISKKDNSDFYFIMNNEKYLITNFEHLKLDKNVETFSTYFLNLLSCFVKFEKNECTNWIIDHYEYLKNRVMEIYKNQKDCYIFQFKKVDSNHIEKQNSQYVNL